ncbi:S8 family serine peptidase [Mangrovivirga sp. M17]|uniref:S8 family serine peptidase n=1 Tax=Mangrovivirga halotolerans TaxID=2993936 RepID=A0ABT3RTH9_9BACT|nr:S8 family serine peptidase [Mangrovivirga halotolerans]MCX2744946.1 S8 family serine peptidase [Mangrovivirga halotolerans]
MRKYLFLIAFLCLSVSLSAQKRYVIKTKDFVSSENLKTVLSDQVHKEIKLVPIRNLISSPLKRSKPSIIDKVFYITKPDDIDENQFLANLKESDFIEFAEKDIVYETYEIPNDASLINQYYLDLIGAYDAWDISKSNSSIVIGIVDSGIDIDHEDLASKLTVNPDEIPNNDIDDDNDGYIDNVRGWDFAGPDTLDFDYPGDPDVNVKKDVPGTNHGNLVAGAAAAATNNEIGVAGVGYNASLLITKHSYDNQGEDDRSVYFTLAGVMYMIEQGVDIVNMSFGGPSRSDIWQEVINFGVENGVTFIAAAGNSALNRNEYPAAYDGVFAVASSGRNDQISSFTNYGYYVDIIAPGSSIYTTSFDNSYTYTNGTSFSAPIVAGAAALIKGKYPDFTPEQIQKLLRVSADTSIYETAGVRYRDKLGFGRLDIFKALTLQSPALSFNDIEIKNEETGQVAKAGDTAIITGVINNSLWRSSNATKVTLSTSSIYIEVLDGEIFPGVIDSTNQLNTENIPFRIAIENTIPNDTEVSFKVTFTDGDYKDFQFITLILNPTYINIQRNLVSTTITGEGRIGFNDPLSNAEEGIGFLYDDRNLLFEMGLLLTSNGNLSNNVRGTGSSVDNDFNPVDRITNIIPGKFSAEEAFGSFDDSDSDKPLNVLVNYRSMVWGEKPDDKYVIVEYELENQSEAPLTDLYIGLYADWDISQLAGPPDRAGYHSDGNINFGFVHNLKEADSIYAAIQTLTGDFNYWAIDNDSDIQDNPWGVYDGYSDEEKIESLTSGIGRPQAGISEDGNDVSHTVSIGPISINSGETTKVAFALLAGDSLADVVNSANAAYTMYNRTLNATMPVVDTVNVCYNGNATLVASGASRFNWYKNFTGGEPIVTNSNTITINNVKNDTVIYVSNATSSFESVRTPAVVNVVANPQIILSRASTNICEGDSILLAVQSGNEYLWSTGSTDRTITVKEGGTYSVEVSNSEFSCNSLSDEVSVTIKPKPTSLFAIDDDVKSIFDQSPVLFTDQSTDAVAWFWNFGDGSTSVEQNPEHTYSDYGDFNVSLTITGENGCQDTSVRPLIVTSVEDELEENKIVVYPNPSIRGIWRINNLPSNVATISIIDIQGKLMKEISVKESQCEIDGSQWSAGLYIIEVNTPDGTQKFKLMKY